MKNGVSYVNSSSVPMSRHKPISFLNENALLFFSSTLYNLIPPFLIIQNVINQCPFLRFLYLSQFFLHHPDPTKDMDQKIFAY